MPRSDRPHPRKVPRVPGELTLEGLKSAFSDCADFFTRTVALGDGEHRATVCFLLGMARNERLQDYVLKPMMSDRVLAGAKKEDLPRLLEQKAVYAQTVKRPNTLDEAVDDLIAGSCAVFLPGGAVLTIPVPTEEKRSIGQPENEPALKGSRESFVESVRTNTSMLRRHLRSPGLRIAEHILLHHDDVKAVNTEDAPDNVVPTAGPGGVIDGEKATVKIPALSWNVIRFEKV